MAWRIRWGSNQTALDTYYEEVIATGRLYPALEHLSEVGFVEKGRKNDRSNEYRLTDAGTELLQRRRDWEGPPR